MAIKNWDFQGLHMDFSSMFEGNDHPSDIDMMYLTKNDYLIIGEIKNELGTLYKGQRTLLEKLVTGWKGDGMAMLIIHNKFWQQGDRFVDVPECKVAELFYKGMGRWTLPKRETKVKEILDYYMRQQK